MCVTVALSLFVTVCRSSEPSTDAERAARGRAILERVSAKLGRAPTLEVDTTEARAEKRAGATPVHLTRRTIVRRPDRLYFKASGDRDVEGWYDGVGLTLALHDEKVFAQARMPETLDRSLDALAERYGFALPLADFLYTSPVRVLLSDTAAGGWTGTEVIGDDETDHLVYKDKGVMWDLWVATSGDQLPRRVRASFTDDKRLDAVDLTFSRWDLAPSIAADRFTPAVPGDYEGIAMLQRAAVLKNLPEEPTATTGK